MPNVLIKNAIRAELKKDDSTVPPERNLLSVTVDSTIYDTWGGTSETYEIWGAATCVPYVTQLLSKDSVFDRVASFFGRREIARVLVDVIPLKVVKPSNVMMTKQRLFTRVLDCDNMSPQAAGVICDIIVPVLMRLGMLTDAFKFSRHVRHPMKRVSINDVKTDVMIYSLLEIAANSGKNSVDPASSYNVEVLADTIAESLRAIGNTMLDIDNLSGVVDDMLLCVRAHLDPMAIAGNMTGSVPVDWINNSHIVDLAKNIVFVRAALTLPAGSSISVANLRRLDRWCAVVVAAIKSSPRYRWLGRSEAIRNFGLKKVRDVKGRVKSAVLYRAMRVEPAAQGVRALTDDFMENATLISATRDQVAGTVMDAYGTARFQTSDAAMLVVDMLSAAVEQGWTHIRPVYCAWGSSDDDLDDPTSLAMLMSEKLWIEVTDEGNIVTEVQSVETDGDVDVSFNPKWWFVVNTKELDINILSGRHYQERVVTSDFLEVFLAKDEFEPKESMAPRAQLLGPAAFNTRIVDFDLSSVQIVDAKFKFDITLNGVSMKGGMRAPELTILRSRQDSAIVRPQFNELVLESFSHWIDIAIDLARQIDEDRNTEDHWESGTIIPAEAWMQHIAKMPAHLVRSTAGQLSEHFRSHVRENIVERSIVSMGISQAAADVMRSRLQQRAFQAYGDVLSLQFFLHLQGIVSKTFDDVITTAEMANVCVERG